MPGTRWLTFDCYGTIADWNTCMLGALQPIAGAHAESLLVAYHKAESIIEALPQWPRHRQQRPSNPLAASNPIDRWT